MNRTTWIVGGICAAAVIAALGIQGLSGPDESAPAPALVDGTQPEAAARPEPESTGGEASNLGDLWKLIKAPENESQMGDEPANTADGLPEDAPFTAEGVREALKAVRLDGNGNLILDHAALQALNSSLQSGDLRLTEQELSALQQMIRDRLPGQAGTQTAQLVGDYYRYLQAETEYLGTTMPEETTADAGSISAHKARYARLRQLREQYLGPEASAKLFRVSDAHAAYMFEAYRIRNDNSLSDEEKLRKVNALNDELKQQYITIDNWQQRYQQFQADKQQILRAGLSDADKISQIKGLLNAQFTAEELRQIEHLELDKL